MSRPMFLSDPHVIPIPGCEGARMHVGENITNSVVFIGIRNSSKDSGCDFAGTGFLLGYKDIGYLVTARHVAQIVDDCPFVIRANRSAEYETNIVDLDNVKWFYPDDKTIDLSISELSLTGSLGFHAKYLPSEILVEDKKKRSASLT